MSIENTGMVRNVDELGRLVIPIEIRKSFDIPKYAPLAIFVNPETQTIILKKYEIGCSLCGCTKNLSVVNNKNVCKDCIDTIKGL
jgi:transcriptional pleiotropic regulator of transition state genes